MAAARLDELDTVFDDHPSLTASLEDFEDNNSSTVTNNDEHHIFRRSPPFFGIPSQHSGFRSEVKSEASESDLEVSTTGPWSPPGFRQRTIPPTSGWYTHQPYGPDKPELKPTVGASPTRSREPSPQYEDALEETSPPPDADSTLPANIPLPLGTDSPVKGRSPSPNPASRGRNNDPRNAPSGGVAENLNNYIRFAIRAEVQHREPFVALFNYLRAKFDSITKSRSSTMLSIIVALFSISILRALFLPPIPAPVPDLVKLSGFARSFEPLIYYSENGAQQIGTLQETGVAVWDLGESVRGTNMTSAPIIVRQLDELSESLKALSLELTKFFANVDADIDSILIVMDWAKRELASISAQPGNSLPSIVFDNFHNLLSRVGALEQVSATDGGGSASLSPTPLGHVLTTFFGPTAAQRTRATLMRTFTEFLSVLEESINSELTHSTALFALFESIDHQFLNLQRTVVRESDAQERAEGEMLSSLWSKVLGADKVLVRKYEKNRKLLASVRGRTVANKHLLMDHRGRLLTLKVNLETLRRKLVSPLVRRNDSISFDGTIDGSRCMSPIEVVVEGQIKGIEGAYDYLRNVREKQKAKLMEMVYGAGARRAAGSILGLGSGDHDGTAEGIDER